VTLSRTEAAVAQDAAAKIQLDRATAECLASKARVQLAEANVQSAELDLGYTYASGDSRSTITGVDAGNFPAVTSKLNSVKADLTYGVNDRLDVLFTWWYENFDSSDWALQGIGPATLPTVLALGADPYNYSVNYVTLSARYSFGKKPAEEAAAGE